MKFHADEHIAAAVVLGLRRRGFDVTLSSEVNLLGATDEAQLEYCNAHGRVMISHDADMLRLRASGVEHAGIAYCHNQKYRAGELLLRLLKLAGSVPDAEMHGRVEFL